MGTETALETAIKRVEPIFDALDIGITVRDIHISALLIASSSTCFTELFKSHSTDS